MSTPAEEHFKTVMQLLAIVFMALMVGTIVHKGYVDISRLAHLYSGDEFWSRLARYLFKNLAGGKA